MEPVLVTGADGFIGSHLVEELVRRGRTVRAFVHYNSSASWGWLDTCPEATRQSIEVFVGDVRDVSLVREAVKGCGGVFHLAALVGIPYSYTAPDSYVATNISGTLNVVQAARDFAVGKIVVTSTSEVYGTARVIPIDEEHPLVGQSPYAATKIGAERLALSFYRSYDTPVAVVRPFNTYGPRQSTRAIIPTIISQVAKGTGVIKLGAVHPTRDFNFVSDTVAGMIAIHDSPASVGDVINIGSGSEISIKDLALTIAKLMNAEVRIETEQARLRPAKSEVDRLLADISKAKRILGWTPKFGGREGLNAGLRQTIDWFMQAENRARYPRGGYTV
jgi:dTDP-glucose 4,6-dehydratase